MESTKNYKLNKVGDDDFIDIVEHFNYNTEAIDDILSKKVNAEEGKTLTDNNFTDELKEKLEQASQKEHSHNNKSVLDKITQALLNAWDSAYNHISDVVRHITTEERNLWNTVSSKAEKEHTHTADKIRITDTAGNYTADNVEGVLQELAQNSPLPRGIIGEQTNWNTIIQSGTYQVGMGTINENQNYPGANGVNAYQWGILLVFNKENLILQVYYPHNKYDGMWFRVRYAATEDGWQEWTNISYLAERIKLSDLGGNYISDNVEGALREISSSLHNFEAGSSFYGKLSEYISDSMYQSNSIKVQVGTFVCGSTENGFNYGVAENSYSTAIFDFNFELDYLPTMECGDTEISRLLGKFKITFQNYSEYSSENTQSKGASYNVKIDYENYTAYGENKITGILLKPYKNTNGTWSVNIYLVLECDNLEDSYKFANNFDIEVTYSKYSNPFNIKNIYNISDSQSGYCCISSNLTDEDTNSKYYIDIFNRVDNVQIQYDTKILDLIISE